MVGNLFNSREHLFVVQKPPKGGVIVELPDAREGFLLREEIWLVGGILRDEGACRGYSRRRSGGGRRRRLGGRGTSNFCEEGIGESGDVIRNPSSTAVLHSHLLLLLLTLLLILAVSVDRPLESLWETQQRGLVVEIDGSGVFATSELIRSNVESIRLRLILLVTLVAFDKVGHHLVFHLLSLRPLTTVKSGLPATVRRGLSAGGAVLTVGYPIGIVDVTVAARGERCVEVADIVPPRAEPDAVPFHFLFEEREEGGLAVGRGGGEAAKGVAATARGTRAIGGIIIIVAKEGRCVIVTERGQQLFIHKFSQRRVRLRLAGRIARAVRIPLPRLPLAGVVDAVDAGVEDGELLASVG